VQSASLPLLLTFEIKNCAPVDLENNNNNNKNKQTKTSRSLILVRDEGNSTPNTWSG
jgi:hypothetical protein